MLVNIDACGLSELDAKSSARMEEFIDSEFERADLNHDGVIDSDEFMLYYFHEICFKFPVGKNGYNPGVVINWTQAFQHCESCQCSTYHTAFECYGCRGYTVQHLL